MAVLVGLIAVKVSLAMLLVVAGLSKAADLDAFQQALALVVPGFAGAAARMLAIGVAGTELLVGSLSLTRPALGLADLAVLALCGGFLAVSLIGSWRHRGASCRCFGALSDQRFGPESVVRSVVLLAAAAVVVLGRDAFSTLPPPAPGHWVLVALALVPTGAAFVLAGRVLRASRGLEVHTR
jgi:hypothetical protein